MKNGKYNLCTACANIRYSDILGYISDTCTEYESKEFRWNRPGPSNGWTCKKFLLQSKWKSVEEAFTPNIFGYIDHS